MWLSRRMASPPPVPLSAVVVAAYVAGLLGGSRGALLPLLLAACAGWASAARARSLLVAGVAAVLAAGALAGHAESVRAERCSIALAARRTWVVELDDPAAPGSFARGHTAGRGCRVRMRIGVDRGVAPAGSTVRVDGTFARGTAGLTIVRASVRPVRDAGRLRRMRSRAAASIDSAFGPDAPLAKALLVAETRSLTPEVRERYAASGLTHMLSISGLHVGLIAVALSIAGQLFRLPPTAARLATLATLAVYIAMIGAPPPAVRAGLMLGAITVGRLLQRPTSPWAALALGAAGPLVDPPTATDLGYQLSVVGVVALVAADALGRRVIGDQLSGWRRGVVTGLLGSTVASVVSMPIVAWTFGRASLIAPVSNLLAAPLMAVAQPMLSLAMLLGWSPEAARFVASAAHPLLAAFDAIAHAGAAVPYASIDVAPTLRTAVLGGACIAAYLAACVSRHVWTPALAGTALLAALAWLPALPRGSSDAELHVIDVGQGDAVAFRTGRGRWLLVDAGRAWRGGDAGRTTVGPYLRRRGGELVAFVLTHPHADHAGGAATIVRALAPRVFYDAAFAGGGDAYRQALLGASRGRVPWRRVRPGDSLRVDDAVVTFLAPDSAWTAALDDPNDASAVVSIRVGAVRFLLTGDAERGEEAWLVEHAGPRLRADVLKVGHHGSSTSTSAPFLDAVRPRLAVISVGAANMYGHPSPATLRALAAAGAQVLRTDEMGSIVVRTDGRRLTAEAGGATWEVSEQSSPN